MMRLGNSQLHESALSPNVTGWAQPRAVKRSIALRLILSLLFVIVLAAAGWCWWVYRQIEAYAAQDQAAPSDAIAVFGAAEYAGKPSPVYRARLDHAYALYHRGIAPIIITLGGNGGDNHTEGAVGRQYLMVMGVPQEDVIAETESRSTVDSARRVEIIARANNLKRLVIVSDATHLFRIHEVCTADGIDVLTSPRPRVEIEGGADEKSRIAHEILSYTLWRLHVRN
jgi:vancomycin permeability regulator SanA